ncbi:MAG: RNA polymerase sigma factor [Phycisphaerales bacterium]
MTLYDHSTDEQLVEESLAGDTRAFQALIERYHDALMRFLIRLTGQRQLAEDVFQDAFLQVHQSLAGFDRERRFKPWLFTIAANKGRDALRKISRRPAVSLSAPTRGGRGGTDGDDAPSFVDLMSIDIPPVSTRIEQNEQSAMVQRALDTLSPRLKETLLLAYFQKLSYAQLSDLLGIPLGTVKSRIHAAVASFAQAWQHELEASHRRESGNRSGFSTANRPPPRNPSGGEHA